MLKVKMFNNSSNIKLQDQIEEIELSSQSSSNAFKSDQSSVLEDTTKQIASRFRISRNRVSLNKT